MSASSLSTTTTQSVIDPPGGGAVVAASASTARELTGYKYLPTNLFVGYGYEDSLATRHNYLFGRTLSGLPNTFSESLLFGHASTSFTTVRDTCGAVSLRPKLQAVAWWCLLCLFGGAGHGTSGVGPGGAGLGTSWVAPFGTSVLPLSGERWHSPTTPLLCIAWSLSSSTSSFFQSVIDRGIH